MKIDNSSIWSLTRDKSLDEAKRETFIWLCVCIVALATWYFIFKYKKI